MDRFCQFDQLLDILTGSHTEHRRCVPSDGNLSGTPLRHRLYYLHSVHNLEVIDHLVLLLFDVEELRAEWKVDRIDDRLVLFFRTNEVLEFLRNHPKLLMRGGDSWLGLISSHILIDTHHVLLCKGDKAGLRIVYQVDLLWLVVAVAADATKRLDLHFLLVYLLYDSLPSLVIVTQVVSLFRFRFVFQAELLKAFIF